MKPTNYFFYLFFSSIFFITNITYSQNFDETWKEFLENNKISNMSKLIRPDKQAAKLNYAKYLLMNTNSDFCQSKVGLAEELMLEIQAMNPNLHKAIPGYVNKMNDLDAKIKAFHGIDAIWKRFLKTKNVNLDELKAVIPPSSICEKQTLAKYSYMTAYYYLCQGDMEQSKNVFENRTLRIAEKTSLRVNDVEGLAKEVAKMKTLYKNMSKLDIAWKQFIDTGVSPGFDIELPLFSCNPIPNIKASILAGLADVCYAAPAMFEKIKQLQAESAVVPDKELKEKIKELETAIAKKDDNLAVLNKAWKAFLPNNKVKYFGTYSYDYCSKEPLIRAYIMDGFALFCATAEEALLKIDSLQQDHPIELEKITMTKINELAALLEQSRANGVKIDRIWEQFVAQGDVLSEDFESTDLYCDNVQEVKDWTMKGLSVPIEEAIGYLDKIEAFYETSDFKFYEGLECRVQKLRIKIWDYRYQVLQDLARYEVASNTYEERLAALMEKNNMGERPAPCPADK